MRRGYQHHYFFGKKKDAPVITLFSAPNYCGKGNLAAYARTMGDEFDIVQFDQAKNKPNLGKQAENAFSYYMVDISVWTDEFLYWLFTYLDEMTEEETSELQRSLPAAEYGLDDENLKYYRIVTNESLKHVKVE